MARVLIVDDHSLIRQGIRSTLDAVPDIEVVGEAQDGVEAEEKARRLNPDLIILDINLPLRDGIETARAIREHLPETRIVMLTAWEEPDKLAEAVDAGADGYILKDLSPQQFISALRSALAGDAPLAGTLALQALRNRGSQAAAPQHARTLTALTMRQREIVRLLAQGLTNKEIAASLGIAEPTVANHLKVVYEKLGVHSRARAAWVYLQGEPGGQQQQQPASERGR